MISGIVYHKVFRMLLAVMSMVFVVYTISLVGYVHRNCSTCSETESSLTMIDVGQGDGFLVQLSTGQRILIDTGNNSKKITQGIRDAPILGGDVSDACTASTTHTSTQAQVLTSRVSSKSKIIWFEEIIRRIESAIVFRRATLDLIIITHDDADHVGALQSIVDMYPVGAVISSPLQHTYIDALFESDSVVSGQSMVRRIPFARAGMRILFSSSLTESERSASSASIEMLFPYISDDATDVVNSRHQISGSYTVTDVHINTNTNTNADMDTKPNTDSDANIDQYKTRASNEDSLIFDFAIEDTHILFTGDAGVDEEVTVLKQVIRQQTSSTSRVRHQSNQPNRPESTHTQLDQIDILKVGHHGSKTSTSKEFVEALSPVYALVSAGYKNRYGHPHRGVMKTLETYIPVSNIIRSDICGTYTMYIYKNDVIRRRF